MTQESKKAPASLPRPPLYVLDKHDCPVPHRGDLASWTERACRSIARDIIDGVLVSTMFVGVDYSFGEGPPLPFETMVLGGRLHGLQQRYATISEAREGHADALRAILSGSGTD